MLISFHWDGQKICNDVDEICCASNPKVDDHDNDTGSKKKLKENGFHDNVIKRQRSTIVKLPSIYFIDDFMTSVFDLILVFSFILEDNP